MATPQELQNALMLKKANPNLTTEQVVNQSRVPVTPTSQINQDRLAKNQANRQAQIATWEVPAVGQQPAPIVNAPVDPNTGLSKPLEPVAQPAPVTQIQAEVKSPEPIKTEVASSTAKTEPVIDYNVSAGREWEIQDNIAKITQTNPNLLKDRNAYNQAFGYETADAGKKALLDSTFSGQVKPSQDDIFNSMRSGVSVWDPKSTEFRQAQARINTFNKYSVYDTASLATSLQSGDLLVGTKAYNDLVSDPTMALKIQKAQAFNKWVVDLVKTGETQMANVLAQNPTVAQALEDGNLSKAEYDQLTNNAEVSAQGKLVETNKTKYETIKAQYDAVEDDVDSEYAGKEVTDSFKAKIVADRRKGMYKDYQIASLEYQNSLGTYTNLKADSTALLAQNMELYKTEQANKAEIAKEERAMQNALVLSQAQFDQKLAQQTQLTNDPTTAITTMIDEYKKLGVPFSRSTQQVISDFQTSGKDLPTYLSELQGLIQSKPEYKRYQAIQQGQMSDAEKMKATQAFQTQSDIRNFAQQKELAKYNNDLNRQEFLFKIENDPEQKAKTAELEAKLNANKSLFDVLGKNVGTYEGNRGYDLAGSLGDPLPAGGNWTVKSIDTAGEQVGSIFIGGKGKKPYGNTVVMQDENGNEIRYSHLQNIGVKPWDILWFGDIVGTRGNTGNVKGANGETLTAEQLKAGRWAHLDVEIKSNGKLLSNADQVNFLKWLKAGGDTTQWEYTDQNINDLAYLVELQEKNPTQAAKDMKELGYSARDLANYKAGNLPLTEKQKNTSNEVMNAIKDLVDPSKYEWNDAVGKFDPKRLIWTQDAEDATIAINNLVAKLTLPNLGVLKWPMSDKDIQFIKEASSKLATTQSNDSFERNLIDAYNLSARRAGMKEIKSLSELNIGTQNSTVGGELNYSKYE